MRRREGGRGNGRAAGGEMSGIEMEAMVAPERLAAFRPEWDGLFAELEQRSVFMSHLWYDCWWRHYGPPATLYTLVARRGGKVVGIAPLMRRRITLHGLPVRAVLFMANGNSLHNDLLVHPAHREEVHRALAEFLAREREKWELLQFHHLPADSPNRAPLCAALTAAGLRSFCSPSYDTPYLEVGGEWNSFLRSRSQRARKTLRNIRNHLKGAGLTEVEEVTDWEGYLSVRDNICHVARNSWTDRVGDSLAHPSNLPFFDDLAKRSAAGGLLSLWLLRLDGEVVAFEFHLRALGHQHALRASFHERLRRVSPGAYLEAEILRRLFQEPRGVTRFDFGGSFDEYKRRWAERSLDHVTLNAFHGGVLSRIASLHENVIVKGGRCLRDRLRSCHAPT